MLGKEGWNPTSAFLHSGLIIHSFAYTLASLPWGENELTMVPRLDSNSHFRNWNCRILQIWLRPWLRDISFCCVGFVSRPTLPMCEPSFALG